MGRIEPETFIDRNLNGPELPEVHSASDGGQFCSIGDDEVTIIIHSHANARRIAAWLEAWADEREMR